MVCDSNYFEILSNTIKSEQLQASEYSQQSPTTSISSDRARPQIYIDDDGVHDFDFKNRQSCNGSHRLKKLSRRHIRSSSSMTDIERNSSSASDRSLRMRFSTFLNGHQNEEGNSTDQRKEKSSHQKEPYNSKINVNEKEDPLPDTKKDLEIRLNYHLSELDILKKTIREANDIILQHQERYLILDTRCTTDMRESMKKQADLVRLARSNRNAYGEFVGYHRQQVERIKHKRIDIELAAGLDPTLPDVYRTMWSDEDWAFLFKV